MFGIAASTVTAKMVDMRAGLDRPFELLVEVPMNEQRLIVDGDVPIAIAPDPACPIPAPGLWVDDNVEGSGTHDVIVFARTHWSRVIGTGV
jgi:hypothetical protein